MTMDDRLARKGRSEALADLLQQARYHEGLYPLLKTQLNAAGFGDDDHAQLVALIARLDSDAARKAEAALHSKALTRTEAARITAAKEVTRKLRRAVGSALRRRPVEGITVEAFHSGGPLGRSTKAISEYINRILPAATKASASLAPYFGGASVPELLAKAKADLDSADAAQELSITALPADTQQVQENKGRLLELIEDMNTSGKIAFDGDAHNAARFNKDLLLRGRGRRGSGAAPA